MAALAAAGIVATYYALRNGSYDLVVRQLEGMTIWWAIAAIVAAGLGPRIRLPRAGWVALGSGAALAALTLLSLGWTESDERTFAEFARLTHYVGIVVLIWLAVGRRTWTSVAAGLAAAASLVTLLAVAGRIFPDTFPESEVVTAFGVDRLTYPLEYWNAVAAWGAMTVALALAWSAHAETVPARIAALAITPVAAVAIYLTESRGGVVTVIAAVALVLALSRNRWTAALHAAAAGVGSLIAIEAVRSNPAIDDATGSAGGSEVVLALAVAGVICGIAVAISRALRLDGFRLSREVARVATASAAVVALLGMATVGQEPLSDAWDEFRNERAVDRTEREDLRFNLGGARRTAFDSALAAFEANPVGGIGPGAFEFWWTREGRSAEHMRDAHSLYLEQLAELGLPGLLLLVGLLGSILWLGILARARSGSPRRAGAAAACTACFAVFLLHAGIDWMWEMPSVAMLGLASGATAAVGAGRTTRPLKAVRPRVVLAVLAGLLALSQLPGILSTQRYREAEDAIAAGDPYRAMRLADDAGGYEPWAASPHSIRALAAEEAGRLDIAYREIREAISDEPTNWRHRMIFARLAVVRGDRDVALRQLAEARRLAPELRSVATEAAQVRAFLAALGDGQ